MKTLLQRLAVSRTALALTYALSEALNRLAFLTPGSRRRREKNKKALRGFSQKGFLNGQGTGALAALPFGRFSMDYNGCEVIASANVLRALGQGRPLGETAAWYESHGIFLGGLWGTHVSAIPAYFRSLGLSPKTLYAARVRDSGAYDAAFSGARAAVFSFWNSAARLRDGIHTVALLHGGEGRLLICNLYSRDTAENSSFSSIADFVRRAGVLPILLVTLP